MRISIIDDDKFIRDLCKTLASGIEGFESVDTYENGESFLSQRKEFDDKDIIILDYNFNNSSGTFNGSNRNGLSVMREMMKSNSNCFVVLISGSTFELLKDEAIEEGAYKYISKNDTFQENFINTLKKLVN